MNPLLSYLLQVIAASGLLYGFYHFVLRNNRFHHYNRFYLLISSLIVIIIPFLNIPIYFSVSESDPSYLLKQFSVFISNDKAENTGVIIGSLSTSWFTAKNLVYILYTLIAFIAFLRILLSLKKIRWIARNNPVEKLDKINFVSTEEANAPFSFFNWLFWHRRIELHSEKGEQIFRHELFHIQQKHSWDIIFIEIFTMIFWINPFFHLMKKELKAIHEFLADEFAVKENKKWEYAELLLMQAFDTKLYLINPFFHNQIKRRIAMLTLSTKPGHQYLRKILVLPVAALIMFLFAFSYKNSKANNESVTRSVHPLTLVVDAGHGGTDPGAKSADGKYSEAKLSLEISKAIQRLSPEYNINVIMTRENENFPGSVASSTEGLRMRVEILNNTKPDAFLSIHSSITMSKTQDEFSGFEIYIRKGVDNLPDKYLASSILQELETIYPVHKEIKQRQDAVIFVLNKANYPAVLLECGYLNNPKDIAFITDKSNQEKVARSILKGIVIYANSKLSEINPTNQIDTIPSNKVDSSLVIPRVVINNQDSSKFVVIDGIEMGFMTDFKNLDQWVKTGEIQSVNVLKGGSAFGKYGAKGKNGVIEIYTIKKNNAPITKTEFDNNNKIFEKLDVEPSFKGGDREWRKYLERNLDVSVPVKKGSKPGAYTVVVQFIVDNEGRISDVKALTKHGYGMEEQAIRVISKGPFWNPGMQNGKIVKAYKRQPITFVIDDESSLIQFTPFNQDKINGNLNEVVVVDVGGKDYNKVFEKVEVDPTFPGGDTAWRKFLEQNLNVNVAVDSGANTGKYMVIIQFVVHKDGSISDLKTLTKHGFGMEEEVMRVMKKSPNWIPAMHKGNKVTTYRKQTITFVISED